MVVRFLQWAPIDMSTTKTCKQCNEEKSVEKFYAQQQRNKDGTKVWKYRDSMCKQCRLAYGNARRRAIKQQAVEYLGGKCQRCGLVDDPCVYDFHHLDPTEKDFSIGKNALKFESIKKELDKCILLCSNCHRKEHKSQA